MSPRVTAVVGEDSHLTLSGTLALLKEIGVEVVATAGDLPALRDAVDRELPDLVVTDVRMPPTKTDEGVALARDLATLHPKIAVIVLSQHASATYALEIFGSGSSRRAYLLKDRIASGSTLRAAIDSVCQGRPYSDAEVVALLVDDRERETLTPRETSVLALIADGLSNTAIADELVVTTRAVERHINSVFAKLGLKDAEGTNRRVLAALAYRRGLD